MPPPGGFEPVKYKRNLPIRGPSGLAILGGVTAVCAYGFYRLGKGNLEKRYVESLRASGAESGRGSDGGQADVKRGHDHARTPWNVASLGTVGGSDHQIAPLSLRAPDLAIWGGVLGENVCSFDSFVLRRELQRENVWSRIHLVPLLLAEGDRDAHRRREAAVAREKEIMRDVKDWEVRVPPTLSRRRIY